MQTQSSPSPTSDSPKGLSKLFILLCPTLVPLDGILQLFCLLAPLLVRLSLVLIPAVLALSRLLYSSSPVTSVLAASSSFIVLFLAEQVNHSLVSRKKGSFKITSSPAKDRAGLKFFRDLPSVPSEPPPSPAVAPVAVKTPVVPTASTAAPVKVPTPPSAAAVSQGGAKAIVDPAAQARSAVMSLESLLYGNELTEDLLPLDVLPTRVQRICEEVGVKFSGGSIQEINKTLGELKKAVGI